MTDVSWDSISLSRDLHLDIGGKHRCPASLRTPPADHASRSQPPPENNATVQRACGDEGTHAQGSSDHANSSGTCRDARSASGSGNSDCHVTGTPRGTSRPHDAKGSDNSDCHVTGTLRGTSRPHDATGSDNSDCHVTGTLRGTSRPHITDSTRGGPVLLSDATTVSEKTGSTSAQLEDIFRQHTPATAKAPAVHDYVAKLVSNYRQGVDSTTAKSLMEKYPLPDNVDMVVPAVNPEIWADLPSTVRDEEKRLRATQRMGHATLAPMLQACSSLTTAVEKGEGLSPAQTAALLTKVVDSCTLAMQADQI